MPSQLSRPSDSERGTHSGSGNDPIAALRVLIKQSTPQPPQSRRRKTNVIVIVGALVVLAVILQIKVVPRALLRELRLVGIANPVPESNLGSSASRERIPGERLPSPQVSITQGDASLSTASRTYKAPPTKITPGQLISGRNPAYPWKALDAEIEGKVQADVTVNERGAVVDVRILSGDRVLAEEVAATLGHWRYASFRLEGQPVAVVLPVTVVFKVRSHAAN